MPWCLWLPQPAQEATRKRHKPSLACILQRLAVPREVAEMSSEQVWQFIVDEAIQFENNGETYFEKCATGLAETSGSLLVAVKNVQLETTPFDKWIVTGTVNSRSLRAHADTQ
jgi:hypothetical protein